MKAMEEHGCKKKIVAWTEMNRVFHSVHIIHIHDDIANYGAFNTVFLILVIV